MLTSIMVASYGASLPARCSFVAPLYMRHNSIEAILTFGQQETLQARSSEFLTLRVFSFREPISVEEEIVPF